MFMNSRFSAFALNAAFFFLAGSSLAQETNMPPVTAAEDIGGFSEVAEDEVFASQIASSAYARVDALFLDKVPLAGKKALILDVGPPAAVLFDTGDLNEVYEPGLRAVFGTETPPLGEWDAWEATYLTLFTADSSVGATGVDSLALPGDLGFSVNGFTLAESIKVRGTCELQSFEINLIETCVDQDGRQHDALFGFRYLYLDDMLDFRGTNLGVANAQYQIETDNDLFGLQFGKRIRQTNYPWGYELVAKAGLYGTSTTQHQRVVDQVGAFDFVIRDVSEGGATLSFVGELNASLIRKINDTWSFRGGYNLIFIEGIALASQQIDYSIPGDASRLINDGGLFLHGFHAGLEATW